MDIFVKRSEKVTIDVYAWTEKENINASSSVEDVPKGVETEIVKFVFRKPNNSDSTKIFMASNFEANTGIMNIVSFQDAALNSLLLEIHNKDEVIIAKKRDIDNLHPTIARAALAGLLEQVSI